MNNIKKIDDNTIEIDGVIFEKKIDTQIKKEIIVKKDTGWLFWTVDKFDK